ASLSPEIAQRTITLFGATKAFNIAGLKTGFLVTENAGLMQHVQNIAAGIVAKPNVLGQIATIAAYQKGDDWLGTTLNYLDKNRLFVANFVAEHLKEVKHIPPEASYLAWLDMSNYDLENPSEFLLENAKIALNDGAWFGPGGEGHVRLNFASSQYIIEKALERIKIALTDVPIKS
ncbi:MAG TPA: aminotransferase class I/II-fold pyridoxal phosphate-dependent enzyme, partial [Trueperaceae bacterium]|nr:aminotransferase class I/II-fold pyridoxal phosphate-dependent enzyme [Trueperaceae bacterium]